MTLYTYLRERAREHPNRIVRDETRSMTFSKLFEEAEEIGRTLSGRLYGILCRSDLDTALLLLACLSAARPPYRCHRDTAGPMWKRSDGRRGSPAS